MDLFPGVKCPVQGFFFAQQSIKSAVTLHSLKVEPDQKDDDVEGRH